MRISLRGATESLPGCLGEKVEQVAHDGDCAVRFESLLADGSGSWRPPCQAAPPRGRTDGGGGRRPEQRSTPKDAGTAQPCPWTSNLGAGRAAPDLSGPSWTAQRCCGGVQEGPLSQGVSYSLPGNPTARTVRQPVLGFFSSVRGGTDRATLDIETITATGTRPLRAAYRIPGAPAPSRPPWTSTR